jgi:hypothetical protein
MSNWIRIATMFTVASGLFASDKAAKLEAKAQRHESRAEELANRKGYNPMAHKWPAMVQGPIDRERQLAAKARRELRELEAKDRNDAVKVAE